LTGAEEAAIADMILDDYITAHWLFTDEDFITLSINCWLMKVAEDDRLLYFRRSPANIGMFKKYDRFLTRRQNFEPRLRRLETPTRWHIWPSSLLKKCANNSFPGETKSSDDFVLIAF
jgi:hypothetical protein